MTIFTAGVIALSFAWVGYKKPAWALASVLFLLPTYLIRLSIAGFPTTLLEIIVLGFLLGFIASLPDYKKLYRLGQINWAIGLFILASAIAVLVSPEKMRALGQFKAFFLEPVLLFYAAVLILSEKDGLKLSLQSLFISSGLVSLFGIFQHFTYLGLPIRFWGTGVEPQRITSVFEYPNALALFLGPIIGLFFVLELKKYLLFKNPWVLRAGLAIMALALGMTLSRGAWLAVLITLSLLVAKNLRIKTTATLAAVLIAVFLLVPSLRERVGTGLSDASSQAHWDLVKAGAAKIMESPLIGNGLFGFRTTLEQGNFQGEIINYPHNIFLNFWVETGLLGLLAFCWVIHLALHQKFKHASPIGLAAGAFLLIVILHGMVDVPYFKNDLAILFWFVLSLLFVPIPDQKTA